MKTGLWRAVRKARPNLTDQQIDELMHESALKERRLLLDGIPPTAARELAREDLFPPDLDPFAGDEAYGPPR